MVDYLNEKTKLNESVFNKEDLFNCIVDVLYDNKIPADDIKGNINYRENEGFSDIPGDFYITCEFEWIFYNEDIPAKQFKRKALEIEKLLEESFKNCESVECTKYHGESEYTSDGYDVTLNLTLSYPLKTN